MEKTQVLTIRSKRMGRHNLKKQHAHRGRGGNEFGVTRQNTFSRDVNSRQIANRADIAGFTVNPAVLRGTAFAVHIKDAVAGNDVPTFNVPHHAGVSAAGIRFRASKQGRIVGFDLAGTTTTRL